jgi:hypothetical protein
VKKPSPHAILAIGLLAFAIYGYPGLMTVDSFDQLEEARKNFYTDGHPPAMAFLWRYVDFFLSGPFGMLLIQGGTFLVGAWLILRRAMSERRAAVVAVVVLLIPPVSTTMIVIWKDCLMAGFFLLGVGLLLDERRNARIAGLVVLSIATAFRYNAPAATLPLVFLLFEWTPGLHWLRRYAISFGAWVAITLLAFGCNRVLTDRSVDYWASSAAVADIVGTLSHVDRDIPDDEMKQLLVGCPLLVTENIHATMRAYYEPTNFYFLVEPGNPRRMFDLPLDRSPTAEQQDAMKAAWKRVITGNLGAYFEHRWWTYREVLGLTRHVPWGSEIRHHDQLAHRLARVHVGKRASWLQRVVHRKVAWIAFKTKIMRPWLYIVMALLLLPMCRGNRDAFTLIVSGLVIEASLFPTALTPDLRYSHWQMLCAILAAILLFSRRVVWKRADAPP